MGSIVMNNGHIKESLVETVAYVLTDIQFLDSRYPDIFITKF